MENKLIGGIGIDMSMLLQNERLMERIFGREWKVTINDGGLDILKNELSAIIKLEQEAVDGARVLLKETQYKSGRTVSRYGTSEGTIVTEATNKKGKITSSKEEITYTKELERSYVRLAALYQEIARIRKENAGNEDKMLPAAKERLNLLVQQKYAEEILIKNSEKTYDQEQKFIALQEKEKQLSYEIANAQQKAGRDQGIKEVNALYSEQAKLISEIGQIQRGMIDAGPRERDILKGMEASRQRELASIQEKIAGTDQSFRNSEREAQLLAQSTKETEKRAQAEARVNDQKEKGKKALDTMYRTMVAMLTVHAIRLLRNTWREAVSFVKEYYDALNEVRIVTGMTEQDANKLGQTYSELAQKMKVSSKEVAQVAAEFWRQGLGEQEVSARLEATIKYAEISSLAFEQSAEIITAATNSFKDFNMTAEKAADIFSYLGDMSAAG